MLATVAVMVARTLLGLLFLSAAVDSFAYVIRGKEVFTPPLSEEGKAFLHDLKAHKAIWSVKAAIDLIAGLMLVFNFHAPLAVLLVLPSSVVIILFQITINKIALQVAAILGVLLLAVGAHYLPLYASLLKLEDGCGPLASGPWGHPR
jgi:hypothetical protein